jgi:hypothetical protein
MSKDAKVVEKSGGGTDETSINSYREHSLLFLKFSLLSQETQSTFPMALPAVLLVAPRSWGKFPLGFLQNNLNKTYIQMNRSRRHLVPPGDFYRNIHNWAAFQA